jgi:hypothetical protein
LLAKEATTFAHDMHSYFDDALDMSLQAKRRTAIESGKEPQRVANTLYGLALEKGMKFGTGLDFKYFVNEVSPTPLLAHEARQYVKVGVGADDQPIYRSIIRNLKTKEKRWELPDTIVNGELLERALHSCIDRASVGNPLMQWLYNSNKIEGTLSYDAWHIFETNLNGTYAACNEAYERRECLIAYNVLHNPYRSQAAFGQIIGCFDSIDRKIKHKIPQYAICYPRICANRGIPEQVSRDPNHMATLWTQLRI